MQKTKNEGHVKAKREKNEKDRQIGGDILFYPLSNKHLTLADR